MEKRDKGRISLGRFLPYNLLNFLLLPAFLPFSGLSACTSQADIEQPCTVGMTRAGATEAGQLDIFIYDNRSGALDSYHRMECPAEGVVELYSGKGGKTVACIVDGQNSRYIWEEVKTLDRMKRMKVELDRDDPSRPVMSGICSIGGGGRATLPCTPLLSKVVVRSLRCDFSGRSYAGEKLKNVKIYLTNVCNGYSLFADEDEESSEFMNIGGLDRIATGRMKNKGYVYQEVPAEIGPEGVRLDREFCCYPDPPGEETAGSPYTRLVIEGSIGGENCWYPITLNRGDGGKGIRRNCRYVLDICLTRKGADNPWTPVGRETAQIYTQLCDWEEKEVHDVGY